MYSAFVAARVGEEHKRARVLNVRKRMGENTTGAGAAAEERVESPSGAGRRRGREESELLESEESESEENTTGELELEGGPSTLLWHLSSRTFVVGGSGERASIERESKRNQK